MRPAQPVRSSPALAPPLLALAMVAGLVLAPAGGPRAPRSSSPERSLAYVGRYDRQTLIDHQMNVEVLRDRYALVSSTTDRTTGALTLLDLTQLPPGGTTSYLARLDGPDVASTVTTPDGWVYANFRRGGLAVIRLDLAVPTLTLVGGIDEPGVYFGRPALSGGYLYVPAHAHGLRVYDLSDPARPRLVGSLETGLDDAWALAVDGPTAYVADGAGGLKIVDVSDPGRPRVVAGENPTSAAGTSEDVLLRGGALYVAAGGAGVAIYDPASAIDSRTLVDTPSSAKRLALVGEDLAVADGGGLQVFRFEGDRSLSPVAHESGLLRSVRGELRLRLWEGVAGWGLDQIVSATWDSVDVYRLTGPDGGQPDITASTQRIRFPPQGDRATVTLTNLGSGVLHVTDITSDRPTFTVDMTTATLPPGASTDVVVTYAGGEPGAGLISIESDDPDERPLPVQVFGETPFLDPGELAPDFRLQAWTYDHDTGRFQTAPFVGKAQAGKVMFFTVFGSW